MNTVMRWGILASIVGLVALMVVFVALRGIPDSLLEFLWMSYPIYLILELQKLLKIYGVPLNTAIDISDDRQLFSFVVSEQLAAEIVLLGFDRLGETNTPMHYDWFQAQSDNVTWIYKNPSGTICAEVVNMNMEMCQFTTVLADFAVVETMYGQGENIVKPKAKFYSALNMVSVKDALQAHIAQVKSLIPLHGKPVSINTMDRYLKFDVYYHQHYVNLKMQRVRRSQWRSLLISAVPYAFIAYWMLVDGL